MTRLLHALLIAALLGGFAGAQAQSWPTRPIRVIVSFPAGSAPDIVCRFVTERLSRAVGQQVIVDNRPGSGNVIAAQAAARSAPDGYNFFCATAATLVSNPHTFKSLPYDPVRDFAPVAMIARGPFFVLVHPGVHQDEERAPGDHGHRREVADRVVGKGLESVRIGNERRRGCAEEVVAVGGGTRGGLRRDDVPRAWAVVDDDLLADGARQPVGDEAADDVGCGARRERHDDADGPRRPALGAGFAE